VNAANALARRAGAVYLLFSIVAVVGEFLFPAFLVSGDPAATARNITTGEATYRLGILIGFCTLVLFVVLVVMLYKLFEDVDRMQALLMVAMVLVGVSTALANLLNKFVPLVLLSGADYLSVFSKPQLDALALGAIGWHRSGAAVATAFWGLWLFPFGFLVIKSGFFPRVLGILLIVAGAAYLTSSVTSIGWPAYRQVIGRIVMPLYFGELPIIFWLLIKGAKLPHPPAPRL
jgi:hypothetical protein